MKNTVKLNESQLRKMIAESVKKVLKEDVVDSSLYIMEKLDKWGDEEISSILQDFSNNTYTPELVHKMLKRLKDVMVQRALDVSVDMKFLPDFKN